MPWILNYSGAGPPLRIVIEHFALPPHTPSGLLAADHWDLLSTRVPGDLIEAASWRRLEQAIRLIPSPAFLLERTLESPRVIQFGTHIWPWRMDRLLAQETEHPYSRFLTTHVRALRAMRQTGLGYAHLAAMWDEPDGDEPPAPQAFVLVEPGQNWPTAMRGLAGLLDDAELSQVWARCAETPYANPTGFGVYWGVRDLPVRVTLPVDANRFAPEHPNWPAVDRMVAHLRGLRANVAIPPTGEPGLTWHVLSIASHVSRPQEALAPLIGALVDEGLLTPDAATALLRPPMLIPIRQPAVLGDEPALLQLLVSLERIKIVVKNGQWVSGKACIAVRPVWRTSTRVWIEE